MPTENDIYESGEVSIQETNPRSLKTIVKIPRMLAQSAVNDFDIYMQKAGYQFSKHEVAIFELIRTADSDQLYRIAEIYPSAVFGYLEWAGLEHPRIEFVAVNDI